MPSLCAPPQEVSPPVLCLGGSRTSPQARATPPRLLPFEGENPLGPQGAVCPQPLRTLLGLWPPSSRPIYGSHRPRDPPLGLGKAPGMWPGGTGHASHWALLRRGDSASLGDTGAISQPIPRLQPQPRQSTQGLRQGGRAVGAETCSRA